MTEHPKFICEKCAGTGQVKWGKCFTCKGKGGWKTSPEQRAKTASRRRAVRAHENRQQNRNNPFVYAAVIRHAHLNGFLRVMKSLDEQGVAWTYDQIACARQILDASLPGQPSLIGPQP